MWSYRKRRKFAEGASATSGASTSTLFHKASHHDKSSTRKRIKSFSQEQREQRFEYNQRELAKLSHGSQAIRLSSSSKSKRIPGSLPLLLRNLTRKVHVDHLIFISPLTVSLNYFAIFLGLIHFDSYSQIDTNSNIATSSFLILHRVMLSCSESRSR